MELMLLLGCAYCVVAERETRLMKVLKRLNAIQLGLLNGQIQWKKKGGDTWQHWVQRLICNAPLYCPGELDWLVQWILQDRSAWLLPDVPSTSSNNREVILGAEVEELVEKILKDAVCWPCEKSKNYIGWRQAGEKCWTLAEDARQQLMSLMLIALLLMAQSHEQKFVLIVDDIQDYGCSSHLRASGQAAWRMIHSPTQKPPDLVSRKWLGDERFLAKRNSAGMSSEILSPLQTSTNELLLQESSPAGKDINDMENKME